MTDIAIIVATHKKYWMPEDSMYLPLHVGSEGKKTLGFSCDNTGDNISLKNSHYCELTGLYWAWKNLSAEYLGLVHYRRHFCTRLFGPAKERVLSRKEAERLLKKADVILPKPRRYWIETTYSQYVHAHNAEDLQLTREIISERCPEYLAAFDAVMKRTWGHRFNMFIMKRELADAYCAWLFDMLFALEERLDISAYSDYDKRVFGFVGERLMDVWLENNKIHSLDIPYVFMEKQNWLKKGTAFLLRKFKSGKDK